MKSQLLFQCDHAQTCTTQDCPHHEPHRVNGLRQCDVAYTYCRWARKDGAICEIVKENLGHGGPS